MPVVVLVNYTTDSRKNDNKFAIHYESVKISTPFDDDNAAVPL